MVESCDEAIDDYALLEGRLKPSHPPELRRSLGTLPRDLVLGTSVALYLLSSRAIEVLDRANFSGWTTYPADVSGALGGRLEGYAGLAVTGRCGPIRNELSKPILLPPPSPRGRSVWGWRGLYFEPNTWDGSDIFLAEGTAFVIVVARVKDVIERAQLSNFAFRPLTSIDRISL